VIASEKQHAVLMAKHERRAAAASAKSDPARAGGVRSVGVACVACTACAACALGVF
jgi:hypothetical protein